MSVQPNEPLNDDGQDPEGQPKINPKWSKLLEVLPDSLHGLVTPHLLEWDQGVTQQFQEIREQYNPYKDFVEKKVDPNEIQQSLMLAQMINEDPASVIEKMVEHFKLEQFKPAPPSTDPDDLEDLEGLEGLNVDALKKHPVFSEFFKNQEQIMGWIQSQQSQTEEEEAQSIMQEYLKELHGNVEPGDPKYVNFDDTYVLTMLAAGVDGADAVKKFQDTFQNFNQAQTQATQQQQPITPPVVVGGAGNTGSGLPDDKISMGALTDTQTKDLVEQYLKAAQQNSNT